MSTNYVALYEGLKIFRDAMLAFLKKRLEIAYGDEWWERGVQLVFRDEDIARLENQFKRRFTSPLSPARPGTEQYEILDINYFTNIFEGNWKQAFAQPFGNDRTMLVWLKEVVSLRNLVAHPETGDLLDDDTWRGLDTMERLLRVVDKKAADKVRQIKDRLRRSWVQVGYQPLGLELHAVGVHYDQGLAKLDQVLIEKEGRESEVYLDFQGHRRRLLEAFNEEKRGIHDLQTEAKKERTLRELDDLSLKYLGMPFSDASVIETPTVQFTAEEASNKIQALEHEIHILEERLVTKQIKRLAQQHTGEMLPILEREIERIQSELGQKRDEFARLKETVTPPVYFSVKRILSLDDVGSSYVEEQLINVSVEITNLGRQPATITYREGFPDTLHLLDGRLEFKDRIGPSETRVLSYTCYPVSPGKHLLFTEYIDYAGKVSGWDRLEDTIIHARPGSEPRLVATRFYRYIQEGIEVLVRLENRGDKIARNVTFKEMIEADDQAKCYTLAFYGDIPGGQVKVVECKVSVDEPQALRFPEKTQITYSDSQGRQYISTLTAECRRIEYVFPSQPVIEGRQVEIGRMSDMVDQVWQLSRGQHNPAVKRLLLIEGIEGTGKTRLVHELRSIAKKRGFKSFVEDSKDRSPVKRILRRLLGLRPDESDDTLIWKRLEEVIPGEQHILRRRQIFALISTASVVIDQTTFDQLKADVLVLIKALCQQGPTLLVFENVQWVPEGAEQELLLEIFHNVLVNKELPLLICATYRPTEEGPPPVVGSLRMTNEHYERIQLGPLNERSAALLIDRLVDFPRFSQELHRFVFGWSRGNPFYLIELLRLLTKPTKGYLMRIGSEWYPAHGVKLATAVPDRIEKVILERAKAEEELGGELDLLRILSVIGFELPLNLIEKLVSSEFPDWSLSDLYRRLHGLKKAGFLVEALEFEGYEFEHQLKREVLYQDEDFPEGERLRLRGEIARILLEQKIFLDPDEQTRQLARHLIRASKDLLLANIGVIIKAAEMEKGLRNFSRSLEYYNAVLELTSEDTFETVDLLIKRSRLHQMRGHWIPAQRDLEQAYKLVAPESHLEKQDTKRARSLRIRIEKEQGHVFLRQNWLDKANNMLYRARIGMEGNLRLKRFFPPRSLDFYRDLVEIYLDLADIWLRKHDFRMSDKACRRAEKLAKNAYQKLGEKSLLSLVYTALGKTHYEQGNHDQALQWYKQALQYAIEQHDRYRKERILSEMAEAYQGKGDSTSARQCYEEALEIQEQLGDSVGLAISFGGIGNLLVEEEELAKAKYYCEQAYHYQQLVGDLNRFWRTCLSLTKIHLDQGKFEEAKHYWSQARAILFDHQLFGSLTSRKQQEIRDLLSRFEDYYRAQGQWEECRVCLVDLNKIVPFVTWDREEQVHKQIALGEACFRTRRWEKAIEAFEEALELAEHPLTRAEIHEWLGDVYAAYEPASRTLSLDANWKEEAQDRAEWHYEEAIKLLIHLGTVDRAIGVYEKLLERIVVDEPGLLQLPFTFQRILREMSFRQRVYDQFVNKAEEVLLSRNLSSEAGDILVYTARLVAPVDDSVVSFDDKLTYLHRAEELYRKGKSEDLVWGLHMLIPTYFRLGLWDEVTRCFEELLELTIEIEDVDEFIEAYQAIWMLEDQIEIEELERFVKLALEGPRRMYFSTEQRMRLFLYTAKNNSHIAAKVKDPDEKRRYEDLALEYYDKVLELAPKDTAIAGVVLNDSALIFHHRKEYDEALQRLNESIRIARRFGDYKAVATRLHNRASFYHEIERFDEAMSDWEEALEFEQRVVSYWDERLRHQDQQPLTPHEVTQVRFDKRGLAITCDSFAHFLMSRGDLARARSLAEQAMQLYREIGMSEAAERLQVVLSISSLLSGTTQNPAEAGLIFKRGWSCPSCGQLVMEGTEECPACGQSLCPECGAALDEDATKCPACGEEFELVCPECGVTLSPDAQVCSNCGLVFYNLCPKCGEIVDLEEGICPKCGQAICPACGAALSDDDEICPICGAELMLFCPQCGAEVRAEDTVCPQCGELFYDEEETL